MYFKHKYVRFRIKGVRHQLTIQNGSNNVAPSVTANATNVYSILPGQPLVGNETSYVVLKQDGIDDFRNWSIRKLSIKSLLRLTLWPTTPSHKFRFWPRRSTIPIFLKRLMDWRVAKASG